ncbi:hypothetical protein Q1695_015194 [Nippostrongylus brasiliensis]|nr:hypothetical protein Q1695_015194 [Nippostrongylus brasiliensis]
MFSILVIVLSDHQRELLLATLAIFIFLFSRTAPMATGSSKNIITRKIALMGYPCVGKSSITLRFVQGHFPDAYDTTIEDLHNKPYRWLGRDYNLKITDTAGQQEYSIFPRSCSVDIDGFILVYAIDDKKSFEIIQVIHDKIMETIGDNKVPIVIVGNKVDLQHASRTVTKEDGSKLAQKWKAAFIETSAKDNTAVQQIFDKMLHQIELARGNISEQSGRLGGVFSSLHIRRGPNREANNNATDGMIRFPNLPKMAEAVGNVDVVAKVESLKKWTIGTFKNSRQQLLEHMGKADKTVDEEYESQCENIKDLHRRYGCVVNAARDFTNLLAQLTQAEKALAESLQQLSLKETAIQYQCASTSESMRRVADHATSLDNCLRYFLSSMETLHGKTIVDTLETIYATEAARIEFDVSRHELESLQAQPTASPTAIQLAIDKADQYKGKYEALKADVRVKLRLLEENRIKVMSSQLEKLQTALAAYFSGNAGLLASSVDQLASLARPANSFLL